MRPSGPLGRMLLPGRWCETVLGDLREEFPSRRPGAFVRRTAALAAIALRLQAAPYGDGRARFGGAALLAVGLALVWGIDAAAWPAPFPPDGYDPVSRLLLRLWAAPHLASAIGAGLLTGRLEWLPGHAAAVRVHVALAQAGVVALLATGTVAAGLATGLALLLAAGVGTAGRLDDAERPSSA